MIVHKAHKIAATGDVSALCYAKPRAINRRRASWTFVEQFVTCPKCRKLLDEIRAPP